MTARGRPGGCIAIARARALTLALVLPPALAGAQTPVARPPGPPRQSDSSAVCRIGQDSTPRLVRDTIFASLRRVDSPAPITPDFARLFLDEVREFWKPPTPLTLPTYRAYSYTIGADTVDAARAWFALEVTFVVRASGRLGDLVALASSTSVAIDESVTTALLAADSANALPALGDTAVDSMTVALAVTMRRDTQGVTMPLLSVVNAVVSPAAPAMAARDTSTAWIAASPPGDVAAGTERIHFVIDERGRVMPGTMRALDAPGDRALQRARAELPRWRFAPAVVRGCAVKSIVEQRFTVRADAAP